MNLACIRAQASLGHYQPMHIAAGAGSDGASSLREPIPICLCPKDFRAVYLTFIQIWDAQHITEILYLKYFYVVVYSDGGQMIVCSPMICSTYGKLV